MEKTSVWIASSGHMQLNLQYAYFFFLADITLFSGGIVIKSSPSSNIHFEFQKSVTKHNLLFPNSM